MSEAEPVIWAAAGTVPIELRRLHGPSAGTIEAPIHLLEGASRSHRPLEPLDLDKPDVKARLYELLLCRGSAFDLYRWVNLGELIRLWDQLTLPPDIAALWAWALQAIDAKPA